MNTDYPPCEIRKLVAGIFRQLGASVESLSGLEETLLVDQGHCAARSFRAGGLMAMWLVEVGILQFYDAEGNMLRTVSLANESERLRRAA